MEQCEAPLRRFAWLRDAGRPEHPRLRGWLAKMALDPRFPEPRVAGRFLASSSDAAAARLFEANLEPQPLCTGELLALLQLLFPEEAALERRLLAFGPRLRDPELLRTALPPGEAAAGAAGALLQRAVTAWDEPQLARLFRDP